VVDEATWRLTREVVECVALAPVQVKGKADPVSLWQVVGVSSGSGTAVPRAATPLVGRGDELARLRMTFNGVVRDRSTRLVTIVGERGWGNPGWWPSCSPPR